MNFKLSKQSAKIVNVNLRKEAAGDDEGAALAADIKVECEDLDAECLNELAPGGIEDARFVDAIYTEVGTPRFFGVESMTFSASPENVTAVIGHETLTGCDLKGFELTHIGDAKKITLRFTIQCHPTEAQVGRIAEKIKEETKVSIESQPDLLDQKAA